MEKGVLLLVSNKSPLNIVVAKAMIGDLKRPL